MGLDLASGTSGTVVAQRTKVPTDPLDACDDGSLGRCAAPER